MLKKAALAAVLAVGCMFATTAYFVSPSSAHADEIAPGPTFSAGNLSGPICSCPVTEGNCVCQWNPPAQ